MAPEMDREDRRSHVRLTLSVPVQITIGAEGAHPAPEILDFETSNLSPGGAFIATDSPLPEGTAVQGHFHLDSIGASVKLKGRVVRAGGEAPTDRLLPGMAIEFTQHGKLGWSLLERLLEAELAERST
jgi:hypothetical protein